MNMNPKRLKFGRYKGTSEVSLDSATKQDIKDLMNRFREGPPVKILHSKDHNPALKWYDNEKKKAHIWDDQIEHHKREHRQPPNKYFDTDKGDILRIQKYHPTHMFSTKKFEISKVKLPNFVDEV